MKFGISKQYPWFAHDPHNMRLDVATAGFNPFNNISNSYSMWHVIFIPYNLPRTLEMIEEQYFMMSLLILGPQASGKEIDAFLEPLIDELK